MKNILSFYANSKDNDQISFYKKYDFSNKN